MPDDSVEVKRVKIRIEGLSDIVFGLALSIGSLILIGNLPQTPADLGTDLALFFFSFVLVVISWLLYTRIMSVLPVEVRGSIILNIFLLLFIALEPYLFYVLQTSQTLELLTWSTFAYAMDVGMIYIILGGLAYIFMREERRPGTELRIHPALVKRFKRTMLAEFFVGGVFLLSALPFFWVSTPYGYLRFDLWYLTIGAIVFWFPGRSWRKGTT